MRISRLDTEDPSGTKRRHFEISIDSPLTILNCRATKANTYLPAYSGEMNRPSPYQSACGCPDSATIAMETSPSSSTGTLPEPERLADKAQQPGHQQRDLAGLSICCEHPASTHLPLRTIPHRLLQAPSSMTMPISLRS
jgi:hypothetical protein